MTDRVTAGMLAAWREVVHDAIDDHIGSSTAYRYLHEAIDVLAAAASTPHGSLLAARSAEHSHVSLDGTLIRTDRSKAAGPTAGVDLWWSGKHHHHGGTSRSSRPGRMATVDLVGPSRPQARHHLRPQPSCLLDALGRWIDDEHVVLAELGYEGENTRLTVPIKKTRGAVLTAEQCTVNMFHSATRAGRSRELPAQDHLQGTATG